MSKGMQKSGVPWADYRWNPLEGCSMISEGCRNCYAAALAHRFHRPWGGPVLRRDRLNQPLHTKKPGIVFVCSTSDVFHKDVDGLTRLEMWVSMAYATQHTFMIPTKRAEEMKVAMRRLPELPNVWLGVTGENQRMFEERYAVLSRIVAARHFVSVEPMLGPVVLRNACPDLVMCGPETGPKKRPCDPRWIDNLQDECRRKGIAFFDKREGGFRIHPRELL